MVVKFDWNTFIMSVDLSNNIVKLTAYGSAGDTSSSREHKYMFEKVSEHLFIEGIACYSAEETLNAMAKSRYKSKAKKAEEAIIEWFLLEDNNED